jgi:hypothetical protein
LERLRAELAQRTAEVAAMQKQRDEARREVCLWAGCGWDGAKNAAKVRGWDCFEEAKP